MKLTIEKLIYGGDGLARLPADEHGRGKAIFLPFVLEGESVEASVVEEKRGFTRGRVDSIAQSSSERVDASCQYFQRCGGCHYQHTGYENQLAIKAAILKENLRRLARLELEVELQVHASPPFHYRNRSRFKVQTRPEFAIGYYKLNSHQLLSVEECPISSPLLYQTLAALWKLGEASRVPEGIKELELFADASDAQMLVEVHCAPATHKADLEGFASHLQGACPWVRGVTFFELQPPNALAPSAKRVGGVGDGQLAYATAAAEYRVSAGAFFQTNRHLTDKLVEVVCASQTGALALDLYAGVGLFSSILAGSFAQVIAVEASPISFADLVHNSPENVKSGQGTTELYLQKAAKGSARPDFVIVDPPRSGLGEKVVAGLIKLGPPRLTYVSCDPATLSRDLSSLLGSGYKVGAAHLVDLFPQTYHLESVFHLERS